MKLHGVVPLHPPAVLETQELIQARIRLHNPEVQVEPGQDLLQDSLGFLYDGRPYQPELRDQPVSEGSCRPLNSSICPGGEG